MSITMTNGRRVFGQENTEDHESLGSYATYAEAQRVVDDLSDHEFEVAEVQIIGSDLRMVEQVTGRLTWPRAVLSGLLGGAWFGLFVGLLLSLLNTASFLRAMAFGVSWGMIFGGVLAVAGFGVMAGSRDFTSRRAIVPSRFEVLVTAAHTARARAVLAGVGR
jgi:hypothetical protein